MMTFKNIKKQRVQVAKFIFEELHKHGEIKEVERHAIYHAIIHGLVKSVDEAVATVLRIREEHKEEWEKADKAQEKTNADV